MSDAKRRIVIVSLDAVGKRDMEFMKSLPNFGKLAESGSFCDNVLSVYPSLTYPAHTSIVT
ncbi:MAG: alkaline phosphatase family protein, partial [Lachnospiraceae bacterium]|nr:alkaline phosphatase family protein [Lachnospiraceae bacterium]